MKILTSLRWLLVLVIVIAAAQPEIQWLNYPQALASAERDSMFVFVSIHAQGCMPCREMEVTTFRDSAVVATLNQKFLPVTLDALSDSLIDCDHWPQSIKNCIINRWQIEGVPSFALIGPSGYLIAKFTDYQSPEQMRIMLQSFLESRKILLELDRKTKGNHENP